MPRNIEIKAEAKYLSLMRARAEAIAGTTGEIIFQKVGAYLDLMGVGRKKSLELIRSDSEDSCR
jgi:hypothetical protein